MMNNLGARHQKFQDLHASGCFVIPNPWDIGSAKVMAANGAAALATTSAGFAFTLGRPDMGTISRDEALSHAQDLVAATPLPVTGDFENGFGDSPDEIAITVTRAAEVGLSGCSMEDTRMIAGNAPYDFELAVERIKAGASAAKALAHPFVFCARADGIMNGHYDADEAIRRIQEFEAAGADLLYVPIPASFEDLARIVKSVTKPFNALAAGPYRKYSKQQFADIGVRRISIGSALSRVTHNQIVKATQMMCGE
ncbi:MAG: isocitrate lyase/phosphoenolpyruvate mutase family protein, partial [Pseudomonadota bacterium]